MSTETRSYTFSVRFESKWGQNVYVVGAIPELGNWHPKPELRMIYQSSSIWRLYLPILPNADILYSYIVLDDFDPNKTPLWEPRTDRYLRRNQMEIVDDWGVGEKVQMIILPKINKPIWRCPMPFSRMFDPSETIQYQLDSIGIDKVACLAHREELEYHTNKKLLTYYSNKNITVHMYEVDDMCTPYEPQEFKEFAKAILDLIEKGHKVCVHCHSGTGRTGLFIACLWKLLTNQSAKEILNTFNDKYHGVLLTDECLSFLEKFK